MKNNILKLFLITIVSIAISRVNAQEGENKYFLAMLQDKYQYSASNMDEVKLQMNKINFLSIQTNYLLDSASRLKAVKADRQFSLDNRNYHALLSIATKSSSLDSIARILDFLSFDLEAKYLGNYSLDIVVEVTVKVLKNGTSEELSGYNVFAKPSMSVNNTDIIQFNPTNNAIRKIRPGKKTFWIERNGVLKEISNWPVSVEDKNTHLVIFTVN